MFGWFKKKKVVEQAVEEVVKNAVSTGIVITGHMPTQRVLKQFQVLNTFFSEDFKTEYVKGQIYNIREGNEKLAAFVTSWEKAKKVKILGG